MPKCVLCDDFVPPWFTDEVSDKCLFCETQQGTSNDNDKLTLNDDTYSKLQVKEEYKIYIKRLMERNKDEIVKKLTKEMQ